MLNYAERIKVYASQRDELETRFVESALAMADAPAEERAAFSAQCFREAERAEADWLKQIEKVPPTKSTVNNNAWRNFNKAAKMPAQ